MVNIAKEAGFSISADDLKNAQSDLSELSDEELEGVAGGFCWNDRSFIWNWTGKNDRICN